MKNVYKIIRNVALSALVFVPALSFADIIEVASFELKEGVSYETFTPLDKTVEIEHVSKQPGFISREAAKGENGEWLVVVHWKSEKDADASMNSFMSAPAASDFIANIDTSTMKMKRYSLVK